MFDLISITNRMLCVGSYFARIERIARSGIGAIILREKDMAEEDYRELARRVKDLCDLHETRLILHSFPETALALGVKKIHLPLAKLRELSPAMRAEFEAVGTSCHSLAELREAEDLGATYIVLGHIFETECKRGAEPRGLEFLRVVCEKTDLPVYAIGGINGANIAAVRRAGARGACLMSALMLSDDVEAILDHLGVEDEI